MAQVNIFLLHGADCMKKTARRFSYMAIVLTSILLVSAFSVWQFIVWEQHSLPASMHEAHFYAALQKAIESGKTSVAVKDLTDFEWERVCVVTPYMEEELVNKMLGFKYSDYKKTRLDIDESYWGLFFVNQNNLVTPIRIPEVEFGYYFVASNVDLACVPVERARLVLNHRRGNMRAFELSAR